MIKENYESMHSPIWGQITMQEMTDIGKDYMGRCLAHLPLDKMAAFSQTKFSVAFLWMKSLYFGRNLTGLFQLTITQGPIDNNPALVQIMASCHIGDKPLSDPMLTRFNDEYMLPWGGDEFN